MHKQATRGARPTCRELLLLLAATSAEAGRPCSSGLAASRPAASRSCRLPPLAGCEQELPLAAAVSVGWLLAAIRAAALALEGLWCVWKACWPAGSSWEACACANMAAGWVSSAAGSCDAQLALNALCKQRETSASARFRVHPPGRSQLGCIHGKALACSVCSNPAQNNNSTPPPSTCKQPASSTAAEASSGVHRCRQRTPAAGKTRRGPRQKGRRRQQARAEWSCG